MSEAMQLLNSLNLEDYIDPNPVNDILVIDAEKRTINIPSTELILGVSSDKDVERKYFKCPRIVGDNIDLSELSLRIPYINANGEDDGYIVEDLAVSGDYITFSWQLKEKVLKYKGSVQFAVCAVKTLADGTTTNVWNTTAATGAVLDGIPAINLTDKEEGQVRDVISQLIGIVENKKDEAVDELEAEAARIKASFPADYSVMQAAVEQNTADIEYLKQNGGGGTINPDDLKDYVTKTEFETALDEIISIQEALIGGDE